MANGILTSNPFAHLDVEGVGELIGMACERARAADPAIKLGACGEHAGDPASIEFLIACGLDSISCSPYRVPIARLAVAQALLASGRVDIDAVSFSSATSNSDLPDPAETGHDQAAGDPISDHDTGPIVTIDEALVLHLLKVRGFVTPDGFVASLGRHPTEIVDRLVADGTIRHIEARGLYALTPTGKERQTELVASYATDTIRDGLHGPYEQFLRLNDVFKRLCTDWQIRDGEPNNHADPAYDRRCIDALEQIAVEVSTVIEAMASTVPRLARYDPRLAAAARCVADGESKRFTGVMCESFHDVWMELHEDLIVLLRIDRAVEGSF